MGMRMIMGVETMRRIIFDVTLDEDFDIFSDKLHEIMQKTKWFIKDFVLLKPYTDLEKLVRFLGNDISLYVVYKLLNPGLFTKSEIMEELDVDEDSVEFVLKQLEEVEVIERKLESLFIPGNNENLAMMMFIWMIFQSNGG
jgi:hypothetical protein